MFIGLRGGRVIGLRGGIAIGLRGGRVIGLRRNSVIGFNRVICVTSTSRQFVIVTCNENIFFNRL